MAHAESSHDARRLRSHRTTALVRAPGGSADPRRDELAFSASDTDLPLGVHDVKCCPPGQRGVRGSGSLSQ